jgi:hypothetical protein
VLDRQGRLHPRRETAGGDQEFVLVLLDTFSEEAPALLAELRGAVESADADATRARRTP